MATYMAGQKVSLRGEYERLASVRDPFLRRAQLASALTIPSVCPPDEWIWPWGNASPSGYRTYPEWLPQSYQSLGADATNNLCGITTSALFEPGGVWFRLELNPAVEFEAARNPDAIPLVQAVKDELFMREIVLNSLLESAHVRKPEKYGRGGTRLFRRRQNHATFYSAKYASVRQAIITGDSLEMMDEDYRLRVLPRACYVTIRDTTGNVLKHVIRESVDVLDLTDEEFARSELDPGIKDKPADQRMVDIYTCSEWQPRTGTWLVTQEVNDHLIREPIEEAVSRFISSMLDYVPGEPYGRGLVEQKMADLITVNELAKRINDAAGICAKMVPVIDDPDIDEKDLARPSGQPIRGRVEGGVATKVAFLQTNKFPDLRFAQDRMNQIEQRVAKGFLMGSESVRRSERTTAYEVQETVVRELQGAQGGIYATLAPGQHAQTLDRLMYQAKKDGIITPFKYNGRDVEDEYVKISFVTGLAALTRQARQRDMLQFLDIVSRFPGSEQWIDYGVAMQVFQRLQSFYQPGLVKSQAQMAAEQQKAMVQQAVMAATEQAIQTTGNVAEQRAAAPAV